MNVSGLIFILSLALAQSDDDILKKGIYFFEHGDYKQSISILNRVLKNNLARDEKELVECYKYLGAAYFYIEDMRLADANFRQLLLIDPEFKLDPFLFPPSMVLFFDRIRNEISTKKSGGESESSGRGISDYPYRYRLYVNLLPFGAPQFANNQEIKGSSVLVLQVVTLTANIFSYWQVNSMVDRHGYVKDQETAHRANIYKTVQISSLVAFGVVYLYSAIDGFVSMSADKRGGKR